MNSFCTKVFPFTMMQPGTLMRIEVKNDIYFEPVNLWTRHTALPSMELGLYISKKLNGYWGRDAQGRVGRLALLGNDQALLFDQEPLDIVINLGMMKFQEVHELYQMLTGLRLSFAHNALT